MSSRAALSMTMAVHRKRSGISDIFGMFSIDPLPLPVLVLVTTALILLLTQWVLSFELSVKPTKGNTHLVLLVTALAIVMLVRWLSSTEVSSPFFSPPRSDGCCQRFIGCCWEEILPYMVAALMVVLVIMGQYRNKIHGKWFLGFG